MVSGKKHPHYVLFLAAESGGRRHNNTSIGARDGGLIV
jgi:hypothetical protein